MSHLVNLAVNKYLEVDPINSKEMIAKEFATHGPKMIEELFRKQMQNTTLNLCPTTSTSTAGKSSADLQHQLVKFVQGYGQEYMEEIVVKRVDGEYLEFTESDYKYLHKNDIEDKYLMCINGKIKDYWQTGLLKSLILFIRIGLIYENNKKEKRVIDNKEILKFCDATLKKVLEKVKKFNLDVKHGYGTNALFKFSPELVLHPLQDKLTLRDKNLDLSAFKLSRLFFSLLSSGSSNCWRSYGAQ
ncbi:hypothetical protein Tco_0465184 [Tanacetum coccineum]